MTAKEKIDTRNCYKCWYQWQWFSGNGFHVAEIVIAAVNLSKLDDLFDQYEAYDVDRLREFLGCSSSNFDSDLQIVLNDDYGIPDTDLWKIQLVNQMIAVTITIILATWMAILNYLIVHK